MQRFLQLVFGDAVADDGVRELRGIDRRQPIVDAVKVDAGREDVRVAPEPERGEVAAVRRAPDADAAADRRQAGAAGTGRRRARLGIRYAPRAPVCSAKLKRRAVADAESVVHRQDDEAAAGEILVDARSRSRTPIDSASRAASGAGRRRERRRSPDRASVAPAPETSARGLRRRRSHGTSPAPA